MRQRGYSHPQLSSGCACRDKRWSGLIPSNKIESFHLLSSVAFVSAQWQCPHLKDTHAATAFHCGSRTLRREIKYSCIRQAVCLCFWKWLCEMGAWRAQDQGWQRRGALPTLQTHSHPGLGPWLETQSETQAWTWVGMQPRAGDKGESARKAEFMIVTSPI